MGQYGAAQPLVDTLSNLEKKYNPAEWINSKTSSDKSNTMNWKPEPNEEQKRQIEKQSGRKLTATGPTLGAKKKTSKKKTKATARKRQ